MGKWGKVDGMVFFPFFLIYTRVQDWIPHESEYNDEWDSSLFWEEADEWAMLSDCLVDCRIAVNFSALQWISNEIPFSFFFLLPKCHTSSFILPKRGVPQMKLLYALYMHVHLWKLIDLGLAVQRCDLIEDDGWIVYQCAATNCLKKCRFGLCAIFSWYPAAESRSQKPRDDRTSRSQRLWSDILMHLSLNHWDVQSHTHRYSKGELSFTFKQDIWEGVYQMFEYFFYCVGYVHLD